MKRSITMAFVFLAQIFLTAFYSHSQSTKDKNVTYLTFHVLNKDLLKQRLELSLIKEEIFFNVGETKLVVGADKNGNFNFAIPGLRDIARFSLSFPSLPILFDQPIEPGDHISIEYMGAGKKDLRNKNKLTFFGKGHLKLTALQAVDAAKPNNVIKIKDPSNFSEAYLDSLYRQQDSIFSFKMGILAPYKKQISPISYQILKARIFASTYYTTYNYLSKLYREPSKKKIILSSYPKIKYKELDTPPYILSRSRPYVQSFLWAKTKASALFNSQDGNVSVKDIFNEIVATKNETLREKLLMYYFVSKPTTISKSNQTAISDGNTILEALNYIKNPTYKKMLSELSEARTKGSDAYAFSLPDTTGKIISLNDFRDRVVIIDCWFTGCASCVTVAKIIDKEVLVKFKDNPNVIFVSINVDKNKETWKQSVKSGNYTNSKSINLYTEGLELNHPFIKKYHFRGFPHVMLIDRNGKIFSAEMPKEGGKMVDLIYQALRNDKSK